MNARRAAFVCLREATSTREWLLALLRAPVVSATSAILAALAAALGTAAWVGLDGLPVWGASGNRVLAIGLWFVALLASAKGIAVPLLPWRDVRGRRRRIRELALAQAQFTIADADGVPIKGESAGGAFLVALLDVARECVPRWSRWIALLQQTGPVFVTARARDSAALDGIESEWSRKLPAMLPRSGGPRLGGVLILGARGDRHFIAAEWQKYFREAPLRFRRRGVCETAQREGVTFALAPSALGWTDICVPRHGGTSGVLFRVCLAALLALPALLRLSPAPARPPFRPVVAVVRFNDLAQTEDLSDPCLAKAVRQAVEDDLRVLLPTVSAKNLAEEQRMRPGSDLDAALRLHIDKLVEGTCYLRVSKEQSPTGLDLSAQIMDVSSAAVMLPSVKASGALDEFFQTTADLSLRGLEQLGTHVTREERASIRDDQMTYENFCGFLGVGRKPLTAAARREHVTASMPLLRWWLPAALAAESGGQPDELVARIQHLAEAYRVAYRENNPDLLAEFYQDFTADMRAALLDYFANADGLTVTLHDVDVRAFDGRAVVSFTRLDEFRDRSSGLPQRMRARLTKVFVKTAAGWQIAAEEE